MSSIFCLLLITLSLSFNIANAGYCNYEQASNNDYICYFSSTGTDELTNIDGTHLPGQDDDNVDAVVASSTGLNEMNVLNGAILQKFKNLRKLSLEKFQIAQISPNAFQNCDNLETVDLSSNNLRTIPALVFENCKKLTSLSMNRNQIDEINTLNAFSGLESLENLSLRQNLLRTFSINHEMPLKMLNLSQNHLTSVEFNADLANLVELDLSVNEFRNTTLSRLSNLRILRLSANSIANFTNSIVAGLGHLEILEIHSCGIERIVPNAFRFNANLREVHMQHNRISILDVNIFNTTRSIEIINLSANNISRFASMRSRYLNSVKHLDLSHNIIAAFPPISMDMVESLNLNSNAIRNLSQSFSMYKLRKLFINDNRISGISRIFFHTMPNLKEIDMTGNLCINEHIVEIDINSWG